jgi:hypothetical protein
MLASAASTKTSQSQQRTDADREQGDRSRLGNHHEYKVITPIRKAERSREYAAE